MQEGSNHSNRVRVNYQANLQCTVTEGWNGWEGGGFTNFWGGAT